MVKTKILLGAIFTVSLFVNCSNPQKKNSEENRIFELLPEPDRAERLKFEAIEKLRNSDCYFFDPDTSLGSIILKNSQSATNIIGLENNLDSMDQYHFYSQSERETLTLTQHPGDSKNQISIFKVEYSKKQSVGYKPLNVDTFKTEKGIKLGLTKKQIIHQLGSCYAPIDSAGDYIELYYIIEQPKDSRTNLLQKHHVPIYYASYKIWKDTLEKFEFGFEYP